MMAAARLEISRSTGIDVRQIRQSPGTTVGVADGACPGCGTEPFLVQGGGATRFSDDTYRAQGRW